MASNITSSVSIPRYPNVNVWAGPGETYSTVRAAVLGEATDITGQGPFVIGVRKAYTDILEIQPNTWNGWITTDSDYVHLWVHPDVRHKGYWDDSKFVLKTTGNEYDPTIYVTNRDVVVQGYQMATARSGSEGNPSGIFKQGSGSLYVSECIIKRISSPNLEDDLYSSYAGIFLNSRKGDDMSVIIENNIIYNFFNGIRITGTPSTKTEKNIIQNNTIIDHAGSGSSGVASFSAGISVVTYQSGSGGSETDLTMCIRNNLVYSSATHRAKSPHNSAATTIAYSTGSGDPLPDTSYDTHNVGWDSSAPYVDHYAQNVHFPNLTPNFVDYAGEDFRLSPGNNEHLRVGLNIRNDDFAPLSIDINGTSRDDGKPAAYVGAHHPQEKGFREFPVDETRMERKYRGRR